MRQTNRFLSPDSHISNIKKPLQTRLLLVKICLFHKPNHLGSPASGAWLAATNFDEAQLAMSQEDVSLLRQQLVQLEAAKLAS
jgi:hypothetical protein